MDDIEADGNAGRKPRTTQESLVQQPKITDHEENSCVTGPITTPTEAEQMHAAHKEPSDKKKRAAIESYRSFANAMLATATFAGTITLTVILTPGNGTDVPGITVLAYSSSIFIGTIMGCICMISSIELNMSFAFVRAEATILGLLLFSAFYLLLLSSSLFLNYRGPFILGSIIYLGFGLLLGMLSLLDWIVVSSAVLGKRMIVRGGKRA